MSDEQAIQSKGWAYTRRSQRVWMRVPIVVRRQAQDENPLSEMTHTLIVSAHGALITLAMDVEPGQKLVLAHRLSGIDVQGGVVEVTKKEPDQAEAEVSISFVRPAPRFWGIDFPPADWKRLPE